MSKSITLHWMDDIRARINELDIKVNSKEWEFIKPIFDNGLLQEKFISDNIIDVKKSK